MKIEKLIESATQKALLDLYDFKADSDQVQIQNTRKDQEEISHLLYSRFFVFQKRRRRKLEERLAIILRT